jgi:lactate dehydrogenase-like 2-hydroxyacid dehydrogenase
MAVVNFPPRQIGPMRSEVLVLGVSDSEGGSFCSRRTSGWRTARGCIDETLISRRLPESVMAEAEARFDVTCRSVTTPMDHAECVKALGAYDMVLPTLGDAFRAGCLRRGARAALQAAGEFRRGLQPYRRGAARAAGVAVTNTPGAVTDATADIAMTLILMTARRAGEGERMVRAGLWTGWHPVQMLGLHLTGKTVCVVGMGRIGQAIARRCHFGFGCRIVYVNRSTKAVDFPAEQMEMTAALAGGGRGGPRDAGRGGDASPDGRRWFAAMQPHAIFVNISRGDVVDEAALIAALQAGRIGGAGLDVYEFEPRCPRRLSRWRT